MDALVNSLMEELNCETVFTIPIFGGIPIYESVVVTWIIMAVVIVLCILLTRNLRKWKAVYSLSYDGGNLYWNCQLNRSAGI